MGDGVWLTLFWSVSYFVEFFPSALFNAFVVVKFDDWTLGGDVYDYSLVFWVEVFKIPAGDPESFAYSPFVLIWVVVPYDMRFSLIRGLVLFVSELGFRKYWLSGIPASLLLCRDISF